MGTRILKVRVKEERPHPSTCLHAARRGRVDTKGKLGGRDAREREPAERRLGGYVRSSKS